MKDDRELQRDLAEVLYGHDSGEELFACRFHSAENADGACRKCGVPMCRSCMAESWPRLICADCRGRLARVNLLKTGLKSLKLPVMWVLICVIASGIAYAVGVGNPSLEKIIERDNGRAWFRQDAPQLLIGKGSRQQRRAAALRILEHEEQAKKWNGWAVQSFARAGELWRGTPVENSIRTAEARAHAGAGDYRAAITILEALKPENRDPAYLTRLYCLGLYYEKLDDKEQSLQWFDKAYAAAKEVSAKSFDNLLDRVLNDRNEAARILKVSLACDAAMSPEAVKTLLKDHKLPSKSTDDAELESYSEKLKEAKEKWAEHEKKEEAREPGYQVEKLK